MILIEILENIIGHLHNYYINIYYSLLLDIMAADNSSTNGQGFNRFPDLPTKKDLKLQLKLQNYFDNLHDFQSRGTKSQIRNSQDIIHKFFYPEYNMIPYVSGYERRLVYNLESKIELSKDRIDRIPSIGDESGIFEFNKDDNITLTANKGAYLLKQIAKIPKEEEIPTSTISWTFRGTVGIL